MGKYLAVISAFCISVFLGASEAAPGSDILPLDLKWEMSESDVIAAQPSCVAAEVFRPYRRSRYSPPEREDLDTVLYPSPPVKFVQCPFNNNDESLEVYFRRGSISVVQDLIGCGQDKSLCEERYNARILAYTAALDAQPAQRAVVKNADRVLVVRRDIQGSEIIARRAIWSKGTQNLHLVLSWDKHLEEWRVISTWTRNHDVARFNTSLRDAWRAAGEEITP